MKTQFNVFRLFENTLEILICSVLIAHINVYSNRKLFCDTVVETLQIYASISKSLAPFLVLSNPVIFNHLVISD